ncbi:RHS repeat-associated core domain-containing protein [Pseudomonas rustica]|uniref:RHS repeat-associated core domain-containing protein n=1 Tax=Pseudomonas rustica TaxID=2827099 RepID=UPI003CF999FB
MDRCTPALAVIDSSGMAVRSVAYCRQSETDAPQARITQNIYERQTRTCHSRDPRLFTLFQNDSTQPANQATLSSLSGTSLLSVNADAGWRLSLAGASGQALESWGQKLNHRRVAYDELLRPAFLFEQEAGEEIRRSECYGWADASAESALHNVSGQLIRHDDGAGTSSLDECSVFGSPLAQTRRFLDALELPDWPEDPAGRDVLLEVERATTRNSYNAAGEQIRHIDALGNEQLLRQTRAGELFETCLKLSGAGGYTSLVSDIRYSATGQIEQQTAGNGVVTRSAFDAQSGQIISLIAQVASKPPLQQLTYAYDAVGNLLSISDAAQPIRYFRNQRVAPLNTYRYNTLYELIEASGRQCVNALGGPQLPEFISPPDSTQLENYQQTFDYDAGGNLLTLQHIADSGQRTERTAVAAYSNRSLPYTAADVRPGEGDIAAGYDGNGNLNVLQKGQNLLWNGRDQLRQVDQVIRNAEPNDAERYIYDGGGQRVRKIRTAYSSRRTRTHETRYLSGVEIRTTPEEILHVISVAAGRCTVQILHWEKGRPVDIPDDQVRYTLTNHLNSNSLELDADARLISQESYYPYGGTAWYAGRDKVEASYRTVRYSGQERDATGLYYYGFRYYMPWRQRWLSVDPGGTHDGLNLYRMVGSNPIGFVDTKGLKRTEVTATEATKAVTAGMLRGGVKGAAGFGAKTVVKMGLNATLGEAARYPLIAKTSLSMGYSSAAAFAHVLDERGTTGFSKYWKVAAMGSAGLIIGGLSGALAGDPVDSLGDVTKDLAVAFTGRGISRFGPSVPYDANATLGSQAFNIVADLTVNAAEGAWLGPLSKAAGVEGFWRSVGNGVIKSATGDLIRSLPVVPASYNESRHFDPLKLPSAKEIAQTVFHDTAMTHSYNVINTGVGIITQHLAGDGNSIARAAWDNLQLGNQADALAGEIVLSGAGWNDINPIPNETTPGTSTEANLQAAEDKRNKKARIKNYGRSDPFSSQRLSTSV